jgi:phage terminase Nu1 subunit (DNA packaging protein)
MAKGRGNKVNRAELASVFGVSLPTVDAWVRNGCPFDERGAGKGKPWVFDTADVAAWRERIAGAGADNDDAIDEGKLRKRKQLAETRLAELELAKACGDVAPVREFERAQAAIFATIRANVMNVPQRVVVQLLGETDESVFKAKLRAELVLALESAASADIDVPEDEDMPLDDDA